MNWEWLGRLIRRSYQLFLGYEIAPVILDSGTVTYTCPTGTVIYAFVSVSSANTIDTATSVDGDTVLDGDVPPQGYEVKCRLTSITFDAITGSVILYIKNINDDM